MEWVDSIPVRTKPDDHLAYIGNNTHHLLNGEKSGETSRTYSSARNHRKPLLPFPDFGQNRDYLAANGAAYYNAVQITFERRFNQGLSLLADYTRSVCKDDYKNILGFSENQFNRAPTLPGFSDLKDYTYCGNDVPNIFHASGVWQLPIGKDELVGKNMSRLADAFIGGWSAQWIVTSQDGFPAHDQVPDGTMSGDFQCYAPLEGSEPLCGKGTTWYWAVLGCRCFRSTCGSHNHRANRFQPTRRFLEPGARAGLYRPGFFNL